MTRQLTKTHPRYQLFGPTTRWGARPRALTYFNTIYPPHAPAVLPPPQNTILAGDFNTHHPLWQPETEAHNTTPGATALIEWLEANGLALCIEPGTPTRGPNTIDLVFSDIPTGRKPPPRRKLGSTDWEKAKALLNLPHKDLPVDDIAEKLVNTVQEAIRGASKYNTRGLPRTPWWTSELTDLLRQTAAAGARLPATSESGFPREGQPLEGADRARHFTHRRLHTRQIAQARRPALRSPFTYPERPGHDATGQGGHLPHSPPREGNLSPAPAGGGSPDSAPRSRAFDAVDHQRLLSHLRLQGWDEGLTSWIHDWLSDRSVSVQVGDATATAKIRGGLPQGSPLSPVLFLLYAAQIVSSQDNSFCYADDLGLLFVGDSLEETSQQLVEVYKTITLSGAASGLPFSLEKTEIQHFSKQRKLSAPTVTLPGVGEIKPSPYTRWLGILLDSKLTYRPHINWVFSRGKQLALHLRKLSNTQRGCPVASMRAAVIQCVIPTALYGAEVFYTGRGQKGLIDSLRSLLRLAALAILPAYRTTPTSALLREADLPYPEALLDGVLQRAAVRYASLDARHPIARVTIDAYDTKGTRLTRILQRVPTPAPERARVESRLPPLRILPTTDANKAAYAPAPLRLTVYSDGSRTGQGAGYGFVVYYGSIPITQGYGPAGSQSEVYDAEIMGAVEGLQAAVNLPCASYSTGLVVLLDNLAAASLLADGRPAPHRRKLTDLFQKLTTQWESAPYILSTPRTPVEVRWMPGHSGIAGNETADELAKRGAALDGSHIPPSPSYLVREAKQHIRTATRAAYTRDAPQAYRDLNIQPHTKSSRAREHRLPRGVLGRLLAARTGHGDFQVYHERFHHRDSLTTCSCGKPKSPVHFFFCPPARKRWKDRWKGRKASPSARINWILSTAAGAEEFGRFVQETFFFKDICPNRAQTCAA
ncbi:hypothetical protein N7522_000442 [Penicillium canescens]|nr:hypothetical protein N7522_000442 [Penicillium canescens]